MKIILQEGGQYVLRFDRGEEVVSLFKKFCLEEKITSGFFHGLGACDYLKLAYYDLQNKKYIEKEFDQGLEICNLTGNVAEGDGGLIVHMHGTFSDIELRAIAGHVMEVEVSGTCEMLVTKFEEKMTRALDPETGLKLFG